MNQPASSPGIFDSHCFDNRVVIVTGGAHGIGKAAVKLLVSLGASVVMLDINQDRLNAMTTKALEGSGELVAMPGDVTRVSDLKEAVDLAERKWGRIDGIVNNALLAEHEPIETCSASQMTQVWETNLLAAWRLVKFALPLLEVQGGSVVNMSSIMAHRPGWPAAPYSSSKAALEGLTRELAVELGPRRIRVNAIAPGPINTREPRDRKNPGVPDRVWDEYLVARDELRRTSQLMQHPWPEPGQSIDVANAIVYLLSDGASFINGAVLRVDGGAFCYDGTFAARDLHVKVASLREKVDGFRQKYELLSRRRQKAD